MDTACPNCGWTPISRPKAVQIVQADLGEIAAPIGVTRDMEAFFRQCCGWYRQRWPERWMTKPNSGRFWAWSQTRTKFKRPEDERIPSRFWSLDGIFASPETAGWLKAQQIRWAKGGGSTVARPT